MVWRASDRPLTTTTRSYTGHNSRNSQTHHLNLRSKDLTHQVDHSIEACTEMTETNNYAVNESEQHPKETNTGLY